MPIFTHRLARRQAYSYDTIFLRYRYFRVKGLHDIKYSVGS